LDNLVCMIAQEVAPLAINRAMKKDFEVPGPHGVANAMNAPIAQTSNRGRGNFVRDILAPAKVNCSTTSGDRLKERERGWL
jgi:hypothetical protein